MAEYQPGVCNIGQAEQRKRYVLGISGIAGTFILAVLIGARILPSLTIGLVLITAFTGFEGLLQGHLNFCAGFASKGIYDTSESGEVREEVGNEEARKKDKVRALQIHMYSFTGALTMTAFLYLGLTIF